MKMSDKNKTKQKHPLTKCKLQKNVTLVESALEWGVLMEWKWEPAFLGYGYGP